MKCQTATNAVLMATIICSLFMSFMAQANIEKTVIAEYDLASGKSSHYEMVISAPGKHSTVTVVPLGMSNNIPSTFKVSTCITRASGVSEQREFRFSAAETDKNDVRLSNIGYFVNENNMRIWWIPLNADQTLMFNQEMGGLIVADPKLFSLT
ncbi:MAG: hypothetical protein RSE62_22965, partial [Citrobacter sp.]